MMLKMILAGLAIAVTFVFTADQADAFGGRGYARRQVRRAHHVSCARPSRCAASARCPGRESLPSPGLLSLARLG